MTHLLEEQLILYYYGESGGAEGVELHLAACAACRSSYHELQRVLAAVDSAPVPEFPADYGERVWRRVQPELSRRRSFDWAALLRPPQWVAAAAIVLLVVAAFLAGRFWPGAGPAPEALSGEQVRERVLLATVAEHLDRSQRILVELVNQIGDGQMDISADQDVARDILQENRILRQSAATSGETAVAGVLDELERILLEIAHGPATLSSAELADLRQRIESQSILFKLRVVGSRVRQRQTETIRELGRRSI
jgi:hypothetical protein